MLHGSMISYANKAKIDWLGVPASSIETHGAVSEPVVREMVAGVLKESGADLALAVSGIAGPSGGTQEKPVGTAFIAVANSAGVHVVRKLNPYDRETFKFVTSNQSLEMLRRMALGLPVKDDL